VVVAQIGRVHAQWLEDPCLGEGAQRLPRDALHDQGEQGVGRVRINDLGAGFEVEASLSRQCPEYVGLGVEVVSTPPRQIEDLALLAQAAGVVDQVRDRDRPTVVGNLRQVLADVVIQRQKAVLNEQSDRECGELLGDRRHVEHGCWRDRNIVLQVRLAIAPNVLDDTGPGDTDCAARSVRATPGREDRVDATMAILGCLDVDLRMRGRGGQGDHGDHGDREKRQTCDQGHPPARRVGAPKT
jgi:hypothetical protein